MAANSGMKRWRSVSGYQWFVFLVAGGAWMFDNLDQRIFSLARIPALSDLMGLPVSDLSVQSFAKIVTAIFLVGWGLGGLCIGALGDRYGRVRLLSISIVIYALGTGMTALASTHEIFAVLRFITGLGIGGVFGLAVTIIADTFDGSMRIAMLALLQVLSTMGNISAALLKMGVDHLAGQNLIAVESAWRYLFAVGALPLGLAILSVVYLREPEAWIAQRNRHALPSSGLDAYRRIFRNREERRNLVFGAVLASTGVIGLWAIGEYAVDLQATLFRSYFAQRYAPSEVPHLVASAMSRAYLLQMLGGAIGMLAFTWVANRIGRRQAFIGGFAAAFVVTLLIYWRLETPQDAYWMMPLMGVAQLGVFAGFAIYLPELFSAQQRGTGVSFCYNLGRFAAAGGSFVSALLTTAVFQHFPAPFPLRYSAMTMCMVFLVGMVTAFYAPETKIAQTQRG